ncbi:MAG: class I SAM-dependent methyltransferase [Polyangiaceae bacterium]|nr:class I SAM-dependent methyltransferase [Polyangiaceae bacterium]MCE7894082.1 class I SAM-dependent methyltransferase [Sorangiineae bacterium PRO1]MCL4753087.1 methyltransferase domain-containing protein [Myxococcales bacterium]
MARPVLEDIAAPYSAFETFVYDRVIAPAVLAMGERIADELAREIPERARVLDVGSGGGQLALEIAARRPEAQVTGLDLSPDQVARASARACERGLGGRVRFVQGSALEQPFGDASFDVVTSVASIKHWPDQAKGLAECARVLVPGGRLFVFEADRGCRLDDARDFVARWRLPALLRVPALAAFRTWVAGQAIDLDDARELVGALPLEASEVRRISGTPALVLGGTKR